MIIRPSRLSDVEELKAIHAAQGFAYDFPEWDMGATVEIDGHVDRAVLIRRTSEAYYLLRPKRNPTREEIKRELGIMLALHKELSGPLRRAGIPDVHAWIPPEISERFGKLMLHMGWTRPLWPCYRFEVR